MAGKLNRNEDLYAASRYGGLEIATSQDRLEIAPREFVELPLEKNATFGEQYAIIQGDRIDVLAYAMLGDSRLWWLIADLNVDVIPDPQYLPVGEYIFIPFQKYASQFA